MIPTFYYFIGFLVYTGFNIITFNTFSKIEDEMKKKGGLVLIYFYYSLLAAYIMGIVDIEASGIEILFQTLVYIIAEGFFLWFNYKNIFLGKTNYK